MPSSRHRLPWVAAQASLMVSLRPTAAAEVTWAIIPETNSRPIDCSSVPAASPPSATSRLTTWLWERESVPEFGRRPPVDPLASPTTIGTTMATAETSTAAPIVARGL